MRLLILGLNYAPEPIGVGRYTAEFASWLRKRGHEVRIIAAPPYYPAWQVKAPYTARRYQLERRPEGTVLRCPLWVPTRPTALHRILHLLSFALSAFVPTLWQAVRWRPDLVWTVEPTAFNAPTALLAARLAGGKACMHVQDFELEAACRLCMRLSPRLARGARALYGWMLRRFDLVSTISRRMRWRLAALGVPLERLRLCPNWVDAGTIRPLATASPMRAALGLDARHVVVLYAGNMGEKQGVETLAALADRLAAEPSLRLVLCGDGVLRSWLESRTTGRANVVWLPVQPEERLNDLLNLADIHLIPQRPEAEQFALPSKLGGILASGRPVVAQATGGEVAAAARRCGIVVPPGDAAAMAQAIIDLARDPIRRRRLGRAARQLAENRFDATTILDSYSRQLERLAAGRRARPWQELLARSSAAVGAFLGMSWTVSVRRR